MQGGGSAEVNIYTAINTFSRPGVFRVYQIDIRHKVRKNTSPYKDIHECCHPWQGKVCFKPGLADAIELKYKGNQFPRIPGIIFIFSTKFLC